MGKEVGMARTLNKLSDVAVKATKKPGRHSDGGGLYLNVSPTGTKSWLFMWVVDGKRREMGMGAYPAISLAKARATAINCREAVAEGRDPIAEKAKEAEPTFGECVDKLIESIKAEWRSDKHAYQWRQTLGDSYCQSLRSKRVSLITTEDVLKVLTPVWAAKSETASRLRGRIERVLEYAKVKGWRSGENPAAWRGNLRNLLPRRQKLQRGHQPAMAYDKVPAFMVRLRASEAMAARALEFTILAAARSGETIGAKWQEIDFERKVWTVPAERMKGGETHVVALSSVAIDLLKALQEVHPGGDFIFAGDPRPGNKQDAKHGRPLSNMAMMMLLRRMKLTDITVHGFRSAFRDWAGDVTSFPRDVAEAALAHKVGNEVERAYRRSDALEKRRKLMQAWADYLAPTKANNVSKLSDARKAKAS
ncbi:tyrosine-type recombinase/integrase [Mesorhizobium sp. SP-1A]|uniref:tyrosine-type recombinase/integrase n=1 Tax=Mesorhizobium sp. SP-1A TaxID=3077840 RepID=UPI0028F6EA3D|nr:integrase arm-type DNA-binding domain-containing protein [Mesorhizobium sp. SP-1A]